LKVLGVVITLFDKPPIFPVIPTVRFAPYSGSAVQNQDQQKRTTGRKSAYKETILTFAPKSPGAIEYETCGGGHQRVESRSARHAEDAA
jgi:hypothetical protein